MKALHISDTHGYADGAADAAALAASMGVQLLHTGDMVLDYFQQDISYLDMGSLWPVVGNHDALDQSGVDPAGYHWDDKPTQAQMRAKFFDPWPERGLTFPTNTATWWSRELPDCRVIGLDVTALGRDLESEAGWLANILDMAPTLVLTHIGPRGLDYEPNGFNDSVYWPAYYKGDRYEQTYPGIERLAEIVFAHAELSGVPCAMLCGHEHADGATVHRGVPVVTVGSVFQDQYNHVYRSDAALTSRLVANLVTFDASGLTVQRLGADSRTTGSRAKMWAYSFSEKRVSGIVSR